MNSFSQVNIDNATNVIVHYKILRGLRIECANACESCVPGGWYYYTLNHEIYNYHATYSTENSILGIVK